MDRPVLFNFGLGVGDMWASVGMLGCQACVTCSKPWVVHALNTVPCMTQLGHCCVTCWAVLVLDGVCVLYMALSVLMAAR
jgi:hypothetical protein